ncbi:MAG: hypothetical protein ACLQVD_06555 [Capsulimonadaceae bacterium]
MAQSNPFGSIVVGESGVSQLPPWIERTAVSQRTKSASTADSARDCGDATDFEAKDEIAWQAQFSASKDVLESLYDEGMAEYAAGRTISIG